MEVVGMFLILADFV